MASDPVEGRAAPRWIGQARILVVNGEESSVGLLRDALARAGYLNVHHATDAANYLRLRRALEPDLVLLDLDYPYLDGLDVLATMASAGPRGVHLPIVMLMGTDGNAMKQRALSLGAKDFLAKPFDLDEALLRIRNLLELRFMHLELRDQNGTLERKVEERTRDLELAQLEVLDRLADAAEYRDDGTGRHTRRVARTVSLLAAAAGLDLGTVGLIARASLLHDLGKIGIPDRVLLKPGRLSPDEFGIMKTHTTIGARILSGGRSPLVAMAADIARSHHEWWDGNGYPDGLVADDIPFAARLVAIADAFDALTHDRPYRSARQLPEVRVELERQSGSQFDPLLVRIFLGLPSLEQLI